MTKFSFEVPIKHLQDFEDLQDFHFTLSMLYDNPIYRSFYEEQRAKGEKTIWLDNSYNEKLSADSLSTLMGIANSLDVDKIIAPDSPEWSKEQIGDAFLEAATHISPKKLICVVKDVEMKEYMLKLGATHFATSYWVRPNLSLITQMKLMPSHFLGLISIPEIRDFHPPTCDTSMPIKLAMKGMMLRDWAAKDYPHIYTHELGNQGEDYFNAKLTTEQLAQARLNIIRLKEVCNEE